MPLDHRRVVSVVLRRVPLVLSCMICLFALPAHADELGHGRSAVGFAAVAVPLDREELDRHRAKALPDQVLLDFAAARQAGITLWDELKGGRRTLSVGAEAAHQNANVSIAGGKGL